MGGSWAGGDKRLVVGVLCRYLVVVGAVVLVALVLLVGGTRKKMVMGLPVGWCGDGLWLVVGWWCWSLVVGLRGWVVGGSGGLVVGLVGTTTGGGG